jgi:hypothetical protein
LAAQGRGFADSGTVDGTDLGKDGAHGIYSLHLGPAAFRFDVAGRTAAANPRFEAGMSGPLAGLFGALLSEMIARKEFSVFSDDAKRDGSGTAGGKGGLAGTAWIGSDGFAGTDGVGGGFGGDGGDADVYENVGGQGGTVGSDGQPAP